MVSSVFRAQDSILKQDPKAVDDFRLTIKDAIWDGSIKTLAKEWKPLLDFVPAMMAKLKSNPSELNIKNILDCLKGHVAYMPPGFPVYPEQPAAICSIFRRLFDHQFSPEKTVKNFNELWNAIHLIEEFEMFSERRDCPFGEDKETRLEALYALLKKHMVDHDNEVSDVEKFRDNVHCILMENWLKETLSPLRALQERGRLSSYIEAGLKTRNVMAFANMGIGSLTFLEGMPAAAYLEALDLGSNYVVAFEGLPVMPKLAILSLAGNYITSFDGLPKMIRLYTLDLQNNEIRSFEGLRNNLPSLHKLDLRGNLISSLSGMPSSLRYNPNLEILLEGCPLDEESIEAIKTGEFKGKTILAKIKFGGGAHVGEALRTRSAAEARVSHRPGQQHQAAVASVQAQALREPQSGGESAV